MPGVVANPTKAIRTIFQESQKSVATHRKLVNSLRTVQLTCTQQDNEEAFNTEFIRCLNRVLPVKKSEPTADRVVKFVGHFIQHVQDKIVKEETEEDEETEESLAAGRFVEMFMRHLLRGIDAKEKFVRLRVCQLIALAMNSLGEIDDDLFDDLRDGLNKRTRDRESSVRVQAVIALARFQSSDDEAGIKVTKALIELLQHDPSAEVRRAVLFNLEQTRATILFIIERARDVDAINRRCIYSRSMNEIGDFRILSIGNRERILRWGLRDRDPNTKKAAVKMFAHKWVEQANNNVLELLERLDVVNSKIAEEAMQSFFECRPEVLGSFQFDDSYWDNLSAESAFLARSFFQFCHKTEDTLHLEETMPEVTRLAFYIQKYTNAYFENVDEDAKQELEFIVEQLLQIALVMDFGDEIGRRKMFGLLRSILVLPELPEGLTERVIEIIRKITTSERDFSQIIMEIVYDLHDILNEEEQEQDPDTSQESFVSALSEVMSDSGKKGRKIPPSKRAMTPEEEEEDEETRAVKELMINLKCLHIAQCMLQNVQDGLKTNTHIQNCLSVLIVPCVRSHEAPIRERGIHCLGLSCLLDKDLAIENLGLFLHCFSRGHEAIRVEVLHILSDIFMTHGMGILTEDTVKPEAITSIWTKAVKSEDEPEVAAAAAESLAKLMLANVVTEDEILKVLVETYFDPASAQNEPLKQALSYFFPVYCHSVPENQYCMARVAVSVIHDLLRVAEDLDEDEEMVSPSQIALQLVDWTDPRRLVDLSKATTELESYGEETSMRNRNIHVDLAMTIMTQMKKGSSNDPAFILTFHINSVFLEEERKVLCSMLGKLYITAEAEAEKLKELYECVCESVGGKLVTDALSKAALNKLEQSLSKIVGAMEEE